LRHLDEQVVDVLLARMVNHGSAVTVADAGLAVRACAHLNYRSPWLVALLEAVLPRMKAEPHRVMAHNMLWSLMALNLLPDPQLRPLIAFLTSCLRRFGTSSWAASQQQQQRLRLERLQTSSTSASAVLAAAAAARASASSSSGSGGGSGGGGSSRSNPDVLLDYTWREDVSQLYQYYLECQLLGLSGLPEYDLGPAE
ncbi:hypothetical protein Agub_g14259, partial [Astrephomene gubernaculifera]